MKTSLRLVRIISQQDCQFYDSLEYSQKTAMCKAKSAFHHYPISTYLEKDIVLIRERLRKDKSSVTILHVWNVTSNHIQKKIGQFTDLWLWHVNTDENMLVTFEIDMDMDPPLVQQSKWTLSSEQLLNRRQFHLSLSRHSVDTTCLEPLDYSSFSIRTFGHKTVRRARYADGGVDVMDLIYDHAIDKLRVRWSPLQPYFYDRDFTHWNFLTSSIVYHWSPKFDGVEIFHDYNQNQNTASVPFGCLRVQHSQGPPSPRTCQTILVIYLR